MSEAPTAQVRRLGRWTYRVCIVDGIATWGPDGYGWIVYGRERAQRKARRVLARYTRDQQRRADVIEIRGTEQ